MKGLATLETSRRWLDLIDDGVWEEWRLLKDNWVCARKGFPGPAWALIEYEDWDITESGRVATMRKAGYGKAGNRRGSGGDSDLCACDETRTNQPSDGRCVVRDLDCSSSSTILLCSFLSDL